MLRSSRSVLLLVSLAACTSYGATDSPVTRDNAVDVPDLEGRWVTDFSGLMEVMAPSEADGEPDDERRCLEIERRNPPLEYASRYIVTFASDSVCAEPDGRFAAEFVELGGELMAVLQPELDTDAPGVMLLYNFYRLRPRDGRMSAVEIDADSLRWHLVEHPAALPFALLEGSQELLITATSEQIAEFLAEHAADEAIWSDSLVLVRLPTD